MQPQIMATTAVHLMVSFGKVRDGLSKCNHSNRLLRFDFEEKKSAQYVKDNLNPYQQWRTEEKGLNAVLFIVLGICMPKAITTMHCHSGIVTITMSMTAQWKTCQTLQACVIFY